MHGFDLQLLPVTASRRRAEGHLAADPPAAPRLRAAVGLGRDELHRLKEAQATGYPREKMYGVWWAGAEPDVKDVGAGAKGYNAVTMQHGAEPQSKVQDILARCTTRARAPGPRTEVGQVLYMRGHDRAMLAVEGVRARRSASARARS
jgi:branched-chain amino acid transport system substrate-binding protein